MQIKALLLGLLICILFAACNKDEELTFDPNASLNFSSGTVLFDTVFTSIGSSSRRLKIYNPNGSAININAIRLAGGNNSAFSLNINGKPAAEASDLKINGNDSINLFVKVLINPTTQNLPFIVEDSVLFYFNGQKRSIALVAYGQNAIFVNNATITNNTTWNSKLPYLIYKSVSVAKGVELTLEAGTKILFHGNSTMSIMGTLIANGTRTDSVVFAGDRLEKLYANESGQWNGLHFYPDSKSSIINYGVIKNGVAGITVDSLSVNASPKLLLTNSIVKNMEVVGLLGYQTQVVALNNLFFNCGQFLLYGAGGGSYNLKQNTFAGYNINNTRKTSAVYLSDFISTTQFSNLSLELSNNIIWGNLIDEFTIDKKANGTTLTSNIKNNLIKTSNNTYNSNGNILNIDPSFVNADKWNFRLNKTSAASNKGINLTTDFYYTPYLLKDLDNKVRLFPSELGSYENN
jgi:hypothetical protein